MLVLHYSGYCKDYYKLMRKIYQELYFSIKQTRFDLKTRDSYFTILVEVFTNPILAKNIFHKSYRVNRTYKLLS